VKLSVIIPTYNEAVTLEEVYPALLAPFADNAHEVPITPTPRSWDEGKKIRWHDGLSAFWTLIRGRLAGD